MRKALFICSLLIGFAAQAQKPLVWEVLGMTTYTNNFDDAEGGQTIPNFPPVLITQFEGEEVAISGYLIPVDVAANTYALSKNPFTACFFCGNAGPETVIELKFDKSPGRFATDTFTMIKGILQLNRDGYGLFFTIKHASLHG